jgi:hypothetical protein
MRARRLLGGTVLEAAACLLLLVSGIALSQQTPAPPADEYVKAHYTKYEFRIPMRDGVKLFTAVYVPKDQSQRWPILMERTPYSVAPYGEDQYSPRLGPSDEFEKSGYIFVYQMYAAGISLKGRSSRCVPIQIRSRALRMWMSPRTPTTRLSIC